MAYNYEEFKKLPDSEKPKYIADYVGRGMTEQLMLKMYEMESSSGRNNVRREEIKEKPTGHFQITDATHRTLQARAGRSLNRFDYTDAAFMYGMIMKENVDRYGNIADGVRAFFGGWNQKNWGPQTEAYVSRALNGKAPMRGVTPAPEVKVDFGKMSPNDLREYLFKQETTRRVNRTNEVEATEAIQKNLLIAQNFIAKNPGLTDEEKQSLNEAALIGSPAFLGSLMAEKYMTWGHREQANIVSVQEAYDEANIATLENRRREVEAMTIGDQLQNVFFRRTATAPFLTTLANIDWASVNRAILGIQQAENVITQELAQAPDQEDARWMREEKDSWIEVAERTPEFFSEVDINYLRNTGSREEFQRVQSEIIAKNKADRDLSEYTASRPILGTLLEFTGSAVLDPVAYIIGGGAISGLRSAGNLALALTRGSAAANVLRHTAMVAATKAPVLTPVAMAVANKGSHILKTAAEGAFGNVIVEPFIADTVTTSDMMRAFVYGGLFGGALGAGTTLIGEAFRRSGKPLGDIPMPESATPFGMTNSKINLEAVILKQNMETNLATLVKQRNSLSARIRKGDVPDVVDDLKEQRVTLNEQIKAIRAELKNYKDVQFLDLNNLDSSRPLTPKEQEMFNLQTMANNLMEGEAEAMSQLREVYNRLEGTDALNDPIAVERMARQVQNERINVAAAAMQQDPSMTVPDLEIPLDEIPKTEKSRRGRKPTKQLTPEEELRLAIVAPGGGQTSNIRKAANINKPLLKQNGLDIGLTDNEALQMTSYLEAAERVNAKYPTDYKALEVWKVALFGKNEVLSTGIRMMQDASPISQYASKVLVENTVGAAGRQATAVMSKLETFGNFTTDFYHAWHNLYKGFLAENGGMKFIEAFNGGKWLKTFNDAVFDDMTAILYNGTRSTNSWVRRASDELLNPRFDYMRRAGYDTKIPGYGALEKEQLGYIPNSVKASKLLALTQEERGRLIDAVAQDIKASSTMPAPAAKEAAMKWIRNKERAALKGIDASLDLDYADLADVLREMNLKPQEVLGGASFTHTRGAITPMTLKGILDTDVQNLFINYANRMSGEVALAKFGIRGRNGMDSLRHAMELTKASPDALDAFDQIAAEILGRPYGNRIPALDNIKQFVNLARMFGKVFNQHGEVANAVGHLGVKATATFYRDFPRIASEIKGLLAGRPVKGGILDSIDTIGGAFGVEVFAAPYFNFLSDNPYSAGNFFEASSLALRNLNYAMDTTTGWKLIYAAQQRWGAEQIISKTLRRARDGIDDVALRDMGMTPEIIADIRKNFDKIAQYDDRGSLIKFDIGGFGKIENAAAFNQAVKRGVGQIFQRTFTGETGKWMSNDILKLFLQFRSFPINAVEKQWHRQLNNFGGGMMAKTFIAAAGLGALTHYGRIQLYAAGRDDKEEYLEKRLNWREFSISVMNYMSITGLANDFGQLANGIIDSVIPVNGSDLSEFVHGSDGSIPSRMGGSSVFGQIVPAAGLAEEYIKTTSRTARTIFDPDKEFDKPLAAKWARLLPWSRHPLMIPLLNNVFSEE